MSNDDRPDWESEMSEELERRVRDLHEAPLTFEQVRAKAMNLQRKRRMAVAGGILAAAAVVVPIAVFAGNHVAGDSRDLPATTQTASGTPAPAPTATDSADPPGLGEVAGGIGVPYLEGDMLHEATVTTDNTSSGGGVSLPRDDYRDVAEIGEELFAYRSDDGTGAATIDVISPAGEVTDTIAVTGPFVVTESGQTIAYLTRGGELITRWTGGQVSLGSGFGPSAFPAAIIGGPSCIDAEAGGDGCRVFLDHGDGETPPTAVDSHGLNEPPVPEALRVQDADGDGLISVQTSSSDTGSCGGVYEEATSTLAFETCDYFVRTFSPDSRHVTATEAYGDGLGFGFASILDARTGEQVARYAPEGGFVSQIVWEDAAHALLTVYGNERWQIVRLGIDGSIEDAIGPSDTGDQAAPAYYLTSGN